MTVREWVAYAEARVKASGVQPARLEAQMLAAHVLLVDRPWLLAHGDEEFPDLAGESVLQRRERQEPLAYILGWREFYGRRFRVTPAVLIPRQETETLVEKALSEASGVGRWTLGGDDACGARREEPTSYASSRPRVLDLGTGSGILAITYKLERPEADVTAVDISADALEVAAQNAKDLGAAVRFILSDGFSELLGESFDLILTNPPYVGTTEELAKEVEGFEPHAALFGGPEGMDFYEMLASRAGEFLNDGGRMLMEVGYRQARRVERLFQSQGWEVPAIHKDLSGVERVVEARPIFACKGPLS